MGDLRLWMGQLKKGETPSVKPINNHDYHIRMHSKGKCVEPDGVHYVSLRVVYVVKSAIENFERRSAIRRSWGFERRFSDVPIRTLFLLGSAPGDVRLQARVEEEYQQFRDIVQNDLTTWKKIATDASISVEN